MRVVTKAELDTRVANLLSISRRSVASITQALIHEVVTSLVTESMVRLDGLGTLVVTRRHRRGRRASFQVLTQGRFKKNEQDVVDVQSKCYVSFRKAHPLRNALNERRKKEEQMDKLGVDEGVDQEALEKAAAEGCPKCGAKVTRHGNVVTCPNCGTEPFEKKERA